MQNCGLLGLDYRVYMCAFPLGQLMGVWEGKHMTGSLREGELRQYHFPFCPF